MPHLKTFMFSPPDTETAYFIVYDRSVEYVLENAILESGSDAIIDITVEPPLFDAPADVQERVLLDMRLYGKLMVSIRASNAVVPWWDEHIGALTRDVVLDKSRIQPELQLVDIDRTFDQLRGTRMFEFAPPKLVAHLLRLPHAYLDRLGKMMAAALPLRLQNPALHYDAQLLFVADIMKFVEDANWLGSQLKEIWTRLDQPYYEGQVATYMAAVDARLGELGRSDLDLAHAKLTPLNLDRAHAGLIILRMILQGDVGSKMSNMLTYATAGHREHYDIAEQRYVTNTSKYGILEKYMPGPANMPKPERERACDPKSREDCGECKQELVLQQERCLGVCSTTGEQCRRRRWLKYDFCRQHKTEHPAERVRRVYTNPEAEPVEREVYAVDPASTANLRRYGQTGRPVNSMLDEAVSCDAFETGTLLFPAYRASGLYYSDSEAQDPRFCGKFWFYEPESVAFLALRPHETYRVFGSKVHAYAVLYTEFKAKCRSLGQPLLDCARHRFEEHKLLLHEEPAIDESDIDTIFGLPAPPDLVQLALRFQPIRILDLDTLEKGRLLDRYFGTVIKTRADLEQVMKAPMLSSLYPSVGNFSGGVGELDMLDGPVCRLAKELDIDLVVLQHEVGGHDAVTEFLDTRPNSAQFMCQYPSVALDRQPHPFPKIWVPGLDALSVRRPNMARPILLPKDTRKRARAPAPDPSARRSRPLEAGES
jgi:hypothetical protein